MNTVFVLFYKEDVAGVYTSYRKAAQAMMMTAGVPIVDFLSEFDNDYYYAEGDAYWMIKEFTLNER